MVADRDPEGLRGYVEAQSAALGVPGVAVGVLLDGEEQYAYHGVTSVENPLPVNAETLFQFGSTGKTFTATALLRLAERDVIDLHAHVRTYLPEFRVADEETAREVTVLQLLNHTAGWDGDMMDDTGSGDDALERYVARMARLSQVTPLGRFVSYNNASLSVAGRIIEKVTGRSYEDAMKDLVLEPLGLDHCFFFPNDIMTRRFAVGHNQTPDGSIHVARPWALPRGGNPAGGMSSNAHDQIAWARFHMGDGRAGSGAVILAPETLHSMQVPTADCFGNAIGDQCGITWWLKEIGGRTTVSHGGTTNGQHSMFVMVPEAGFAVISLTNCGPNGPVFNDHLLRWVLERYLGITQPEPAAEVRTPQALAAYAGRYETIAAICQVSVRDGGLEVRIELKPEALAALTESGDEAPEPEPPLPLGLLAGGDRYVVTAGSAQGMTGYFHRDDIGTVDAIHLGGRLAVRRPDGRSTRGGSETMENR